MYSWVIVYLHGMQQERKGFDSFTDCFDNLADWLVTMYSYEPDNPAISCHIYLDRCGD